MASVFVCRNLYDSQKYEMELAHREFIVSLGSPYLMDQVSSCTDHTEQMKPTQRRGYGELSTGKGLEAGRMLEWGRRGAALGRQHAE